MNEICQLHVTDVKPIEELWCLDINNKTPDKSLNNPTSRRIISIPQTLIDLGFIKYVQTLEKKELRESFQNSHLVKMDIQGTSVDSSMRNIFQKLGLKKKGKSVHSFRHTLTNHLKQLGINENYVDEFTGHKWNTMTFGTYSQKYEPKVILKECVSKIKFNLDIDNLRVSDWYAMLVKSLSMKGVSTRTTEIDNL